MSGPAMANALRDWADERDAAKKGGGEFANFARLIAKTREPECLERLADLYEFHASEEALG